MIALLRWISGSISLSPLRYLTIVLLLIAMPVFSATKEKDASVMDHFAVYIIEFKEKPLVMYQGHLAGYPATSPSQTGKKLDFKQSDVKHYRTFLDQKKTAYLQTINRKLKRDPLVLKSYDVSFFGIALQLTSEEVSVIKIIPGIKQIRLDELRILMNGSKPNR